ILIKDSKDQALKVENLSFEVCQELEKAPHEIYVQNFLKNEVNDNTTANENLNNYDNPRNWSSKKKFLALIIVAICGITTPIAGTNMFIDVDNLSIWSIIVIIIPEFERTVLLFSSVPKLS
ncbi:3714_t:CDS:2, partial [Racocetra persica]